MQNHIRLPSLHDGFHLLIWRQKRCNLNVVATIVKINNQTHRYKNLLGPNSPIQNLSTTVKQRKENQLFSRGGSILFSWGKYPPFRCIFLTPAQIHQNTSSSLTCEGIKWMTILRSCIGSSIKNVNSYLNKAKLYKYFWCISWIINRLSRWVVWASQWRPTLWTNI